MDFNNQPVDKIETQQEVNSVNEISHKNVVVLNENHNQINYPHTNYQQDGIQYNQNNVSVESGISYNNAPQLPQTTYVTDKHWDLPLYQQSQMIQINNGQQTHIFQNQQQQQQTQQLEQYSQQQQQYNQQYSTQQGLQQDAYSEPQMLTTVYRQQIPTYVMSHTQQLPMGQNISRYSQGNTNMGQQNDFVYANGNSNNLPLRNKILNGEVVPVSNNYYNNMSQTYMKQMGPIETSGQNFAFVDSNNYTRSLLYTPQGEMVTGQFYNPTNNNNHTINIINENNENNENNNINGDTNGTTNSIPNGISNGSTRILTNGYSNETFHQNYVNGNNVDNLNVDKISYNNNNNNMAYTINGYGNVSKADAFAAQQHLERFHRKQECPVCHNFYSNLATHKSTHLKPQDRPYKCDLCDRGFSRHNDLIRHKKSHWKDNILNKEGGGDPSSNDMNRIRMVKTRYGIEEETLLSLYNMKGAYMCPYNKLLVDLDLKLHPEKLSNLENSHYTKCHPTGVFSRCDTYKNHLKALHFDYPDNTRREDRGSVPGSCKHCGAHFENVDIWLKCHVAKGCGHMYH